LQAEELHNHEEQAERPRADRDEEVLPVRSAAHRSQGDALTREADDLAYLVELAKHGDRAAFEHLVRATSTDCYALALRLVGNEHDARDVLQETYLRAFRKLGKFRGDSAFRTWLHRITVNCSATLVAKRRRSAHDELDDELEVLETRSERDPETAAGTADDRERLVEALADLPDQMRLVVVLRDVYDLAHEEIARELGISQTAAKVRLHRARRRLREQLFAPAGAAGGLSRQRRRPRTPAAAAGVAVCEVDFRIDRPSAAEPETDETARHVAAF
jgi:RNA polymerase sigma-70 factor (ECF subfamily)